MRGARIIAICRYFGSVLARPARPGYPPIAGDCREFAPQNGVSGARALAGVSRLSSSPPDLTSWQGSPQRRRCCSSTKAALRGAGIGDPPGACSSSDARASRVPARLSASLGSGSAGAALIAEWRGAGRRAAPPVLGWMGEFRTRGLRGRALVMLRAELGIVASPAGGVNRRLGHP
jgi:hypothetical protein